MENKTKLRIIEEIKSVEIDLSRNNSATTIRNFVDTLNQKDPSVKIIENGELKQVFKEFYENNSMHSSLQESLLNRFFENDGITKYIVPNEVNLIPIPLNLDNNEKHFNNINDSFQLIEKSLTQIEEKSFLNTIHKLEEEQKKIKVIEVFSITGASKVDEKLREARKIYYNYKSLIDNYGLIKLELQGMFNEFEKIRNILKFLREDLMNMLIEIYGENVKATHPELFSFDSVKWMDFTDIIDNLNAEFYKITETCKTFFSSYNESYNKLANDSLDRLDQMNGEKGALRNAAIDIGVNALFTIAKSNQDAKMTISDLNFEIEIMKASFWNDSKNIRLDIMRLLDIHKNIKEYLIPATKLFTIGFSNLFENEIKKDFNLVFNLEHIKPLKDRNIEISLEIRKLEIEIHHLRKIVDESKNLKDIYESNVNFHQKDYDFFMLNEPQMPSRLTIFLSLGVAVNIFYKVYDQWDKKTIYTRNEYNYNLNDYHVETERENVYQTLMNDCIKKKSELKIEALLNSEKINNSLNAEGELKAKISQNLKKIAGLSKAAKDVLEIKLDEKLLETVALNF